MVLWLLACGSPSTMTPAQALGPYCGVPDGTFVPHPERLAVMDHAPAPPPLGPTVVVSATWMDAGEQPGDPGDPCGAEWTFASTPVLVVDADVPANRIVPILDVLASTVDEVVVVGKPQTPTPLVPLADPTYDREHPLPVPRFGWCPALVQMTSDVAKAPSHRKCDVAIAGLEAAQPCRWIVDMERVLTKQQIKLEPTQFGQLTFRRLPLDPTRSTVRLDDDTPWPTVLTQLEAGAWPRTDGPDPWCPKD